MFTWEFDAADGVYKSSGMSNKLLEVSAIDMKIVPFTSAVPGYGKGKGQSVTLHHYKDLPTPLNPALNELTRIPIDKLVMDQRVLTVEEWGRGAEYTHLAQQLSKYDPDSAIQKKLRRQMERSADIGAANGFKQAKVKFIPTAAGAGTFDVDGVPSTQALVNVDIAHIAMIRDYMVNDLHVPWYEANSYVGLATTKFLRGIKNDDSFEKWMQYLRKGDVIFNSEVGRLESVRFVEINHEGALSNSVGNGGVLGEAVIFGDEAVARVEAEAPHLRANPNYQGDFGRVKAVAWYGILCYGTWWDTANDQEAKIVHITSM
jgi:N4-gp56 family major capsid protein